VLRGPPALAAPAASCPIATSRKEWALWHLPPSPTPCALSAQGLFAGLYQAYQARLGCPLVEAPQVIQDAEFVDFACQ
jgi:hypothetical protein